LEINQQHVNEESSEEAESEENKSVSLGTFIDENSNILSLFGIFTAVSAAFPSLVDRSSQAAASGVAGSLMILMVLIAIICYRLIWQIWHGLGDPNVPRVLAYTVLSFGILGLASGAALVLSDYPEIVLVLVDLTALSAIALYGLFTWTNQGPIDQFIHSYRGKTVLATVVRIAPPAGYFVMVLFVYFQWLGSPYIVRLPDTKSYSLSIGLAAVIAGGLLFKLLIVGFSVVIDSLASSLITLV
jgi:hypothetical protein